MRFGAAFIITCMIVIAGSLGLAAYLALGFSPIEGAATAVTIMSALAAYNAFAARAEERAETSRQISELSRGIAELARQVGELGRRVITMEAAVAHTVERTRATTEPLGAEMEVLGSLMRQLAESVAAHEAALQHRAASPAAPEPIAAAAPGPAAPSASSMAVAATELHAALATIEPASVPEPEIEPKPALLDDRPPMTPAFDQAMAAKVRDAIGAERVDLYLQAIVTLPQRKARYYDASTRLRSAEGALLPPADCLAAAEGAGLAPALDRMMLHRVAQIAERLTAKNPDAAVFYGISRTTLADGQAFAEAFDFLSANRALARGLVLTLTQDAVAGLGPVEQAGLAQIAGLGFRLALDRARDLRIEPRQIGAQGFRFVRTPAAALLSRSASVGMNIHPSDLSNLFSRHNIELIADEVETEGAVVDLLDYELRLGQGGLFGAPRPVRPEVFQAAGEPASQNTAPAPGAPRRRAPDPATQARSAVERDGPQGLVKLARNIMRRA